MAPPASARVAALWWLPCVVSSNWSPPIVETENGRVKGTKHNPGLFSGDVAVDAFWGIPYAAAPIGENRFRPPQRFEASWAPAVRPADSPANHKACTQLVVTSFLTGGGEDCLFINVFRPDGAGPDSKLPVLVFFYGGGYFVGDGYGFSVYDGVNVVARHQYVVVTLNYRLGALGFMALPELAEKEGGTTGNYGVQDQRAALQWVQRNIKMFGGDPRQVTIEGESAGAFSVMWHLVSPGSAGLFHGAIMESGTSQVDWFYQNATEAYRFNDDFAAILGCNLTAGDRRIACLRSLKAETFVYSLTDMVKDIADKILKLPLPKEIPDFASPLWPLMPFGPLVDGTDVGLPDVPIKLIERGQFNKVPLIVGANKDGGAYFGPLMPLLWGGVTASLGKLGEWILPRPEDRQQLLALYGTSDFGDDTFRTDRAIRDLIFQCSDRFIAQGWSKAGLPAFLYVFSFDFGKLSPITSTLGDAHAFELPFVWRNFDKALGELAFDEKSYANMADIMSCTWASFVQCQAAKCPSDPPNCEKVLKTIPSWPAFSAEDSNGRLYMSLSGTPHLEPIKNHTVFRETDEFPGDDRCNFWASAELDFRNVRQDIQKSWIRQSKTSSIVV